jgi:hypothetical protein
MDDVQVTATIDWKNDEVIRMVDEAVDRSVATGDPLIALEYGRTLQKEGIVRGLAVAKILYKIEQRWAVFESAGVEDDFETIVYITNGYKPDTIKKYVRLWKNVFENHELDDSLKQRLAAMPISQLLLLSAAASEGDLTPDDWNKVTVASNKGEVREIVRGARGERTSSGSSVSIKLFERDGGQYPRGTLVAYQGDESIVVGYLTMEDESPLFEKALARITNGAGVAYA